MEAIAHIQSPFGGKFGVPRQSGLAPLSVARIIFEPRYRNPEALRGLEGFDYIWLIWEFRSPSAEQWSPTVRPPRLGGNRRMGVFATRSTFRPNPIGLSSVRLLRVLTDTPDGPLLEVSGADLMDGTAVFDIKPYLRYCDSHPDAACGWVDGLEDHRLEVKWACEVPPGFKEEIEQILALDPRPSYIDDESRCYGFLYRDMDIRFQVTGGILTILSTEKQK
ncbi:MAG: tRNA (N6-threonylcarbamoyladenosine(37)-N6)-methyltransferase TrmO [Bacteroidales bacterium]|nr:tRNA (N6-threonylcarbamoyladenosine(37)-N6)-methyltransferase TrmO [Bacteroidales bacterium]